MKRLALIGALVAAALSTAGSAAAADDPPHAPAAAGSEQDGADAQHDPHGASAHGPVPFDPDLAIFTLIVFLVLLAVLWKFAWGPIAEALDRRERGIADQIAAAQKANDDARGLLEQYQARLADAQVEVRAILDEARRDAEHTQQEILAKARADAQAERDRGLREIHTATDQALKELAERSSALAVELAGRIVRAQLKPEDHAALVEEAMSRFVAGRPSAN